MLVDENEILKKLASAREKSEADYWDAESNLTGVFCVGYVTENQIVYTTDCAGMQLVYHGLISDKLYIMCFITIFNMGNFLCRNFLGAVRDCRFGIW